MTQATINTVYSPDQSFEQLGLAFRDADMRVIARPKLVGDLVVFVAERVTHEAMKTVSHCLHEGVAAYTMPDGTAWAVDKGKVLEGAVIYPYPPDH